MQKDIERNDMQLPEDEAMTEMLQENMESNSVEMSCEDAIALMKSENIRAEELGYATDMPCKKQINRILTVIEKTELVMVDFFKRLAVVDSKFDNAAKAFFNNAVANSASIKNPTEESKKLVLINVASGIVVKGMGALWQSMQTELQLRGIIQAYAQEADEKMPYIGMLIDWLDSAGDIAFEKMLYSSDIDAVLTYLDLYRGLEYNFKLACYLYSVYDTSLRGEFTQLPYPTMYDVNKSLISNLAHIVTKDTETEQLESNRNSLSNVATRIKSVMTGETELPELIDVLIASDDQLMATAINMGMPAPDSFEEEEEGFDQSPHFPFENLEMVPESIDYVSNFTCMKGCGNSHPIADKINANETIDKVVGYIEEFKKNQRLYDSRENLYGFNCLLLAGVTFMLFWEVWDWKWYWSLLMGIVIFVLGVKFSPFSSIRQICRNKAILLERDLTKSTKESAGYADVIDFHKLRRKNNNVFICAIIFGGLGCFIGPFGFICGVAIGSIIGWIVKTYKLEEKDWRDLSIGSGLLAKIWCGFLSICLLYLLIFAFSGVFSFLNDKASDKESKGVNSVKVTDISSPKSEVVEAVEVAEKAGTETEAIRDLYRIFYFKEEPPYATISKELKNKFEDLGITSSMQEEPYTQSFQTEINRMEAMSEKVLQAGGGLAGFDYDILFGGQESPIDLNMQVSSVEKLDDNNVIIKVNYHMGYDDYVREFKMKRINGTFKIDDMDDLRSFIVRECNDCQKWLDEEATKQVSSQTVIDSVY